MLNCANRAWNNFVMRSSASSYEMGCSKRAAAIGSLFMSAANNGGLNSFLTATYDLDANEVVDALTDLGASKAAQQLETVIRGLGVKLPASTQEARETLLDERWHDGLDEYDVLTEDADEELMAVLIAHVAANADFYDHLD